MATFEVKTRHSINVQGEYVDAGLSIQASTMLSNPFDEAEKIHKAFLRVHGLDLKTEGYLSPSYLEFKLI